MKMQITLTQQEIEEMVIDAMRARGFTVLTSPCPSDALFFQPFSWQITMPHDARETGTIALAVNVEVNSALPPRLPAPRSEGATLEPLSDSER